MLTQTLKLFLYLLFIGCLPAICAAESYEVTVVVKNSDGKAVEGVIVSSGWRISEGKMVMPQDKPLVKTDKDGTASFDFDIYGKERPILVMTDDKKLGAVGLLKPEHATSPLELTLVKTVKTNGKLASDDLSLKDKSTNIMVTPGIRRGMVVLQGFSRSKTDEVDFEFHLPPGDYAFFCYGQDLKKKTTVVEIKEGESQALEPIKLDGSPMAKLRGKPAPEWVIKEARGVDKSVKLSDYKGKWVLLEFWGYW